LQRPSWGTALPEELEDCRDQARVHKLLSQKNLVGADRLAEAALVPHLPLLLSPTQLQQVGQQLALVPLPAPVTQWQINTREKILDSYNRKIESGGREKLHEEKIVQ
jgi:hypothetical protein